MVNTYRLGRVTRRAAVISMASKSAWRRPREAIQDEDVKSDEVSAVDAVTASIPTAMTHC